MESNTQIIINTEEVENMNKTMIDLENPKAIEERNNRKLTADKIRQILSKVLNNPSSSAKRWVWELMQNAKDVPNSSFEGISIQLELNHDTLKFRHNGDPFRLQDLFSLVQQVSSKDSSNKDEKVTGKFGTGFIATHILSDIIGVEGYVGHRGEYRKFNIDLDRSGETSEDLLPKITKALNKIHKIDDNNIFPIEYGYINNRSEGSFDTCFTYFLSSEEKKKSAINGIKDLVNTLPVTLVNIPSIKSVEVFNNIENSVDVYSCSREYLDSDVSKVLVSAQGNNITSNHHYFSYDKGEIILTTEVNNFEELELLEFSSGVPHLFRDFPLIGSDKFHFPFLLNGKMFNPTEDRDAILLHAKEGREAVFNRETIDGAFEATKIFSKWLVANDIKNRYNLALTRLPDEKWEDFSKEWYKGLQKDLRSFLLDQRLVETDDNSIEVLSECKIPQYGSTTEIKESFHSCVRDFVGLSRVPSSKTILKWINALGPKEERNTWSTNVEYSLDNFLKDLESVKNINNLSLTTGVDALEWLNNIYVFLVENNNSQEFRNYAIIPNIYGDFVKLSDDLFFEEEGKVIPDEFIEILNSLGKDWKQNIVRRGILVSGIQVVKKNLSDVGYEINNILNDEKRGAYGYYNVFNTRQNSIEILQSILRINNINNKSDTFRNKIFAKGCEVFNNSIGVINVVGSDSFNFNPAMKLYTQKINNQIGEVKNIEGLSELLSLEESNTLLWLDGYLTLLSDSSDLKKILESEGNIIPNRKREFIAYEDAESFGTSETPLDDDLVKILYDLKDSEDWNKTLVIDGISVSLPKQKKFDELGNAVTTAVNELDVKKVDNPDVLINKKDVLLDLIDWVNKHDELATKYLLKIKENSTKLFFELTIDGDSNIDIQAIKLLQKEGNKDILQKIDKSEVSTDKVLELMSIIDNANIDEILKQASEIKEENDNFKRLLSIGTEVEVVFKDALSRLGGNYTVTHSGQGSFDLSIINNETNKNYSIEVKSYKNGSNYPFRFAESQVDRAIKNDDNFAICTFERPINENVTEDNIISGIMFKKETADLFIEGKGDKQILDRVLKRGNIHAEILGSVRVQVAKSKLKEDSGNFNTLIDDIIKVTT